LRNFLLDLALKISVLKIVFSLKNWK